MTNFNITATDNKTYIVKADSDRFGKQAIVFESYKYGECAEYVNNHGGEVLTLEKAIEALDGTNVQVSSNMFHRIKSAADLVESMDKKYMSKLAEKLFENVIMITPLIGKFNYLDGIGKKRTCTVKLGRECTW